MSGKGALRKVRARGGFLSHFVPEGGRVALCGFSPGVERTARRRMALRHGWTSGPGLVVCERCFRKAGIA